MMIRLFATGCFLLMMVLSPCVFASVEGAAGRKDLQTEKKDLTERIDALQREQDYLLFRKWAYATDSKYLVLSLHDGTGQLRYKNRVLRDFRIRSVSIKTGNLKQGAITLTAKNQSASGRQSLTFGSDLAIRMAGTGADQPDGAVLCLGKKDFKSVFYALEQGAKAYILP